MEQKYEDFNGVGKRMPYRVPVNFFDMLEENVMRQIATTAEQPNRKAKVLKILMRSSIAAAAALAMVVGYKAFFSVRPVDSFAAMEQAFDGLSQEDQEYLLEVYQDDIFIDEDDINDEI